MKKNQEKLFTKRKGELINNSVYKKLPNKTNNQNDFVHLSTNPQY